MALPSVISVAVKPALVVVLARMVPALGAPSVMFWVARLTVPPWTPTPVTATSKLPVKLALTVEASIAASVISKTSLEPSFVTV